MHFVAGSILLRRARRSFTKSRRESLPCEILLMSVTWRDVLVDE